MAVVKLSVIDPEDPSAGWAMQGIDVRRTLDYPYDRSSSTSTSFTGYAGDDELGWQGWFTGQGIVEDQDSITGGRLDTAKFEVWIESEVNPNEYYRKTFDIDFGALVSVETISSLSPLQLLKRVLEGDDKVTGTAGDDALVGYRGDDRVDGQSGRDILDGGAGDDWLAGRNDDDRLKGGDGDDMLIGGRGRDVHYGGEGRDTFVFNRVGDSVLGAQRDVIADFQTGIDKLDLSRIDANGDPSGGDQSLVWIGSSNFTYVGQVRFADGILEINTDDNLRADFQLRIKGAFDGADLIV